MTDAQIRKLAERFGAFGESDMGDGSGAWYADADRVIDFARAVLAAEAELKEMRRHGNADDATEAAAHLERLKHGR